MYCRTLALSLMAAALVAPVYSQQNPTLPKTTPPQPQEETIRVSTAAVQLDVIVTSQTGGRITGLSASDFQVLDEGRPAKVDFFTAIEGSRVTRTENGAAAATASGGAKTTSPTTPLATPYSGRYIALVFDDMNMSAENFQRTRHSLIDYINAKVGPNDMTAVISTSGSIGSLQQFTSDKQRLMSAINRISARTSIAEKIRDQKFKLTLAEAIRIESGDRFILDQVVGRVMLEEAMEGMPRESIEAQVRARATDLVGQVNLATINIFQTMENLFRGMADLPGRKVAVLLTESLTTQGGTSGDVSNHLLQLIELARRSGVSVYALDAGGLRTGNVSAGERITGTSLIARETTAGANLSDFENLSAARALASGTGGEMIVNTNNLSAGIDRAVEDSSSYYVVGFRPEILDNKFHRLTVTIKGKPDLAVRTRRGYLAVNQDTVRGTNTELADALISPVPRVDLPLDVVANVVPKSGSQVVVTGLHVGRNYLTLPNPNVAQKAEYDVLAWVFAAGQDKPVGIIKTTVSYDLANPDALKKLKTEGFLMAHTFTELAPGLYQIRAVVREKAGGALGSNYQFFEVPDAGNRKVVSLSGLVLTAAGQEGFSGHNTFQAGSEVDLRYVIYNLPKSGSELTQRVRLLDNQGHILLDSPLGLSAAPVVSDQAQFPQGTRLKVPTVRGRYALILSLRDAKGKVDIERRADLVVQ